MASYILGNNEKNEGPDSTLVFANREYYLELYHIPTGKTVQFKAFLTAFNDRYDSKWKDEDVYGRMDPLSTYQRTSRNISLGWDVVANGKGEAQDNMRRVSLLASFLYPAYDNEPTGNASSISTSPLLKLSFANWIKSSNTTAKSSISEASGLVGKINGALNITPVIETGFFDSAVGILYPKEYKISFDFTVFHTHRVGWNKENKEFFAKNFPYGLKPFGDPEIKKVKEESKSNKTTQQKQAAVNKITGRSGGTSGTSSPDFFPVNLPQSRAK